MLTFLRGHWQLILVMLVWLVTGWYMQEAVFLLLPLSVLFFKSRELWPEILFGLLLVLVLSDMQKDMFLNMIVFKDAKNFYMLAVSGIFLLETRRFAPLSGVFNVFLPFFIGQVVRAYGWLIILGNGGMVNEALGLIGVPPMRSVSRWPSTSTTDQPNARHLSASGSRNAPERVVPWRRAR